MCVDIYGLHVIGTDTSKEFINFTFGVCQQSYDHFAHNSQIERNVLTNIICVVIGNKFRPNVQILLIEIVPKR